MKVPQYGYLSPEAKELRRRDGVPPWGVHVCEVDGLDPCNHPPGTPMRESYEEAVRLRAELES